MFQLLWFNISYIYLNIQGSSLVIQLKKYQLPLHKGDVFKVQLIQTEWDFMWAVCTKV